MAANVENIRAWVAALRSGEYEQGEGMLRSPDDRFCCLGVACDLAEKAGAIGRPTLSTGHYVYGVDQWAVPPQSVVDWLGLDSNNPKVRIDTGYETELSLAELNDLGRPFNEIADLIEAEWPGDES